MFKKFTIFTMSALLAFAAFTTGCKKAEEKAEAETKAEAKAEENSPVAVVEKYLAIDSGEALSAVMPLCAPEYKEYINGQEVANYNMLVFGKEINNALKSNDPDKICQTYIDLIKDDDVWASIAAVMGMVNPSVSKDELMSVRNMIVMRMQNASSEQKQMLAIKMKEMMDTTMKVYADAGKNTKIIGSEINGDTATVSLVTAVTDPEVIAVMGKEVQKKISLKKIDGQWKITTLESTIAK